jgi:FMN phosphatase YigB (HAD superfamily)
MHEAVNEEKQFQQRVGHRADCSRISADLQQSGGRLQLLAAQAGIHLRDLRAHTMIRAILFDFENVLVESPRLSWGARDELFDAGAANVYAFLTARRCRLPDFARFRGRQRWIARWMRWVSRLTHRELDPRRFLRKLCHDYVLQRDDAALATLGWLWHQPTAQLAIPRDGVPAIMQSLSAAGLRLGLVFDTPLLGGVIDQHLISLGWLELFHTRSYSSETGTRPDGKLLEQALDELGIRPSEAAIVSGSPRMLASAQRLGMQRILFSDAARSNSNAQSDHVISRVDEIAALVLPAALPTTADPHPSPTIAHQIS